MVVEHPALIYVKMSVSDALLIKVLFLFKVLDGGGLPL